MLFTHFKAQVFTVAARFMCTTSEVGAQARLHVEGVNDGDSDYAGRADGTIS